ncbi:MAG TPA: hypothetical protein VNH38_07785 [Candidatus Dormibacteraeota bacterium]|nr:hypothetical protein [Candidatus Dormibacteraeota bacterium]
MAIEAVRPLVVEVGLACDLDPAVASSELQRPSTAVLAPAAHFRQGGTLAHGVRWGSAVRGSIKMLGQILDLVD